MSMERATDVHSLEAVTPAMGDIAEQKIRLRMGWRIALTLLLLALLIVLGLVAGAFARADAAPAQLPMAQSVGTPLVLAFYYTWFDENSWRTDQLSDLPAEPYVSRDRAVMGRHIDQAKRAGIDAFLVAWYGPSGQFNQTEPNLAALLEEAAARDFKIGILFETDSPFFSGMGDVTGALQHAAQVHFNHPAYLRVDGKPVIFFWRPTIYGVESWRSIRNQVDPNYNAVWISEGVDTSYLRVFDGHHLYSNTWKVTHDLTNTNQKFARLVNQAQEQFGGYKIWVATVMPGYDDVRVRPGSGFAKGREGGAYYARSWSAAMASTPNWIVITSFNEWPEGTYIEPSAAFGDQYLQLTAQWSSQFKNGGGVAVQAADLAPPPPTPTPIPEPDSPTAFVQASLVNLRSGPGTDFEIVGQTTAGTALAIVGRRPAEQSVDGEAWWQVEANGQPAWIFGQLVQAAGPLEDVPVAGVPIALPASAPQPAAADTTSTAAISPLQPDGTASLHPFLARMP